LNSNLETISFLAFVSSPGSSTFFFFWVLYYFSVKDSLFGESRMEEFLDEKEEDSTVQ
jgi:hypothetical protein